MENIKIEIEKILFPIIHPESKYESNFTKKYRKISSREEAIPDYYLIFFLFDDLLKYPVIQQPMEKTAWVISLKYKTTPFSIAYTKFGIRYFYEKLTEFEKNDVNTRINKATKKAKPFFKNLTLDKLSGSELNVENRAIKLYDRYSCFLDEYISIKKETVNLGFLEGYKKKQKQRYLAIATIDSFYSWTEQVFLLISILKGLLPTGKKIIKFSELD